ncbi:MAG: cell division protein FtsZ [Bacteroidota bacterium]
MIQFDLPKQKSSIIKVLGVGGGGSNAVNFMFHQDIEGVDFIICNTDSKAIEQSPVPNKIQLGPHLTQGLGAGADPSVGKLATEESLEEIKKILEVNTKMAFITVGMGGGTGTGGAPIIAKICKDLGILTVGIVTTPFGFEGPRRQKQAEDGINQLKPLVDTLLVISNDKLRVQYGNLKMKEAFTKADNVLATAAKCITDVINSRGHIIVDFADVCTVMKNGGVAILGKAEVEGENRAQRAIEEALNSPLLNDNDIKGAKWILLNINSAEGDFECSMDELETISTILRERTGEHSDVIMGSGYDDTLGEKIGITLIATGFEGKNPFKKDEVKKEELPTEEKIVMTLAPEAPAQVETPAATNEETIQDTFIEETTAPEEENNQFVLSLEEEAPVHFTFDVEETVQNADLFVEAADNIDQSHLAPSIVIETPEVSNVFVETPALDAFESTTFEEEVFEEEVHEEVALEEAEELVFHLDMETPAEEPTYNFSAEATEFVLSKPTNIYAEETAATLDVNAVAAVEEVNETIVAETVAPVAEVQVEAAPEEVFESSFRVVLEEEPAMQLVVREQDFENSNSQSKSSAKSFEMPIDDSEEQRRKVRERIQKLRNLSFNVGNGNDPSAEFDEVPAYVRRNMDLFGNTLASVENYYSKYTVDQDENNQTQISTINTFLDGKKPD